jgi:hypothetical protein
MMRCNKNVTLNDSFNETCNDTFDVSSDESLEYMDNIANEMSNVSSDKAFLSSVTSSSCPPPIFVGFVLESNYAGTHSYIIAGQNSPYFY